MGEVAGTLSGQGRKDKATFVPHVYTAAQNAWIDAFLKSNSYIPYETVKNLDISDPKQFLKHRYSSADFMFLESSLVSNNILSRAEGGIEDVLSSGMWTEISTLFPSGIDPQDTAKVLNKLIESKKFKDLRIVDETFLVAEKMFEDSKKRFQSDIERVAEEEATKQAAVLMAAPSKSSMIRDDEDGDSVTSSRKSRKDERQKKQQPAKNVQKTGKSKKGDTDGDNEEMQGNIPDFLSSPALIVELQKIYDDATYELLNAIVDSVGPDLLSQYRRTLDEKAKIVIALSANDRKRTHKSTQDQIYRTICLMRLFSRGIDQFSSGKV